MSNYKPKEECRSLVYPFTENPHSNDAIYYNTTGFSIMP
jgi:hypothetical protein